MIDEVLALDGNRLDVLTRVAVAAARHTMVGPVVEQNTFPIRLVFGFRFLLRLVLLLVGGRRLYLFLGLHHLEERIAEQLLLQVLLEVEQRHVQQIHRLIQARIDPQVLPQRGVLMQAGLHAAGDSRARRRVVSVGPRYSDATRSSNTSCRTVPATCTWPSNMM